MSSMDTGLTERDMEERRPNSGQCCMGIMGRRVVESRGVEICWRRNGKRCRKEQLMSIPVRMVMGVAIRMSV